MKKYKVCVYAISKNEEKYVKKWYDSMKEADEIYVLDTGSTDKTVSLLKSLGVIVKVKKITPFRFDVARNLSLEIIHYDYDILVCTDLDEVFNKGWREELEKVWDDNTNKLRYIYNWSLDKNDKPLVSFYYEKIHDRKNYKWVNPIHEVLKFNGIFENIKETSKIILNHYPDLNKSRAFYLSLLELAVKENPTNDRNMHYLGREYMYHKKYNEAIDVLIKHLNLKTATFKEERSASMRYISKCYQELKRYDEAFLWIDKAINETPYLRDPYVSKAFLCYLINDFKQVKKYALKALRITNDNKTYFNEAFSFDNTLYDLLAVSYFNLKNYNLSLKYLKKALKMDPSNKRLLNNLDIIKSYLPKK